MKRGCAAALWMMAAVFLLAACAPRDGEQYRRDLLELIDRSDEIVVTEHSAPLDFYDPDSSDRAAPKELVYARVTLTAEQRRGFRSGLGEMPASNAPQDAVPACAFVARHRIEFFVAGKLIDTMEVCFQCAEVRWESVRAAPPWALAAVLRQLVQDLGLHPERDWGELARASRK